MTHPVILTYPMKRTSFSDAEFASKKKLTRRERFLAEIEATAHGWRWSPRYCRITRRKMAAAVR